MHPYLEPAQVITLTASFGGTLQSKAEFQLGPSENAVIYKVKFAYISNYKYRNRSFSIASVSGKILQPIAYSKRRSIFCFRDGVLYTNERYIA
jgi:hypothetical protein